MGVEGLICAPILLFFFPVPLQLNKGTQAPTHLPLRKTEFSDLPCPALSFRRLLLLCGCDLLRFLFPPHFPPALPQSTASVCLLDFLEAKPRTGKPRKVTS
ncbi:hypothetical protein SLEP1_g30339 [Rubroshorea leprosula]|uniref:Secreted protein n=1 Tax=Rubroshorea leprosula TaxID=152421 RepID=A0AAV5K6G5_9ROSI|nr:hypothetical protein SLEP1_g30339 [Rubroshorea leprosula]